MADIPVNKGDIVNIDIMDITHQGEGVGRHDGFAVFVNGALPGEKVRAEVTEVAKSFARAQLINIIKHGNVRVAPRCEHFQQCGGCNVQHLQYSEQLLWKKSAVENALSRIGHIRAEVFPVIGMQHPWHYRNKAQFQVGTIAGNPSVGFYAPASHRLIPINKCHLLPEEFTTIAERFNRYLRQGTQVTQLWLRKSFASGEIMAVIFTPDKDLAMPEQMLQWHEQLVSVAVIDAKGKETAVYGQSRLRERIGRREFYLSPLSFFQVNPMQTAVLYEIAQQYANLTKAERLWDLYCGTGTIGLFMADDCHQVVGIETNAAAVHDARDNADLNGITNAKFYQGKAEKLLPKLWQPGKNVVLLDPPRQGCKQELLDNLLSNAPDKIIYISCNPATLARDLKHLSTSYQVVKVQPVDMFPQSTHVECVVLMSRNK